MPDVSVVVRTKDRPLLLARALRSIAAQTLSSKEIVVVNDGGDAALVERQVADAGDALGGVTVVHHDEPVGRPVAMNVGVRASTSGVFVFHDDDDSWHPEFLARVTQHLAGHADDLAVATRCEVVWERIEGDVVVELSREVFASDVHRVLLSDTLYRNSTPPICIAYRRSAYDAVGGYDDDLVALADWEFLLRVLRTGTVGFIDGEPLAYWHQRRDDLTPSGNSVHADQGAHARFNQVIRDRYLRRSLDSLQALGNAMFVADGLRRIDEKADAARAELSRTIDGRFTASTEHVEAVHASLANQMQDVRGELVNLDTAVRTLVERLDRLEQARNEPTGLRRLASGAKRRLRAIRR